MRLDGPVEWVICQYICHNHCIRDVSDIDKQKHDCSVLSPL